MESFLTVVHILAALFMILVVLVQGGNSGGVGAAFGGGNSQGVFGAGGATSFLGKITYGMAAIFMVTSISLSVIQGTSGKTGMKERLEEKAGSTESTPKSK
jgi:preprotein translocase subunit SecG